MRDLRTLALCFHHADLRSRLCSSSPLERTERLFLIHLELLGRVRTAGDQRRYQRYPVRLDASLHTGETVLPVQVVDVSAGGLGVVAPRLPDWGTRVRVVLHGARCAPLAECAVRWRRVHGREYRVGLEILCSPVYLLPVVLGSEGSLWLQVRRAAQGGGECGACAEEAAAAREPGGRRPAVSEGANHVLGE